MTKEEKIALAAALKASGGGRCYSTFFDPHNSEPSAPSLIEYLRFISEGVVHIIHVTQGVEVPNSSKVMVGADDVLVGTDQVIHLN